MIRTYAGGETMLIELDLIKVAKPDSRIHAGERIVNLDMRASIPLLKATDTPSIAHNAYSHPENHNWMTHGKSPQSHGPVGLVGWPPPSQQ